MPSKNKPSEMERELQELLCYYKLDIQKKYKDSEEQHYKAIINLFHTRPSGSDSADGWIDMTDIEKCAYEWALEQPYQSVAARYARTLAEYIKKIIPPPSESRDKGGEG